MIVARQPVSRRAGQEPDRAIVAAVGGILAPGVVALDPPKRQGGARSRHAVVAPPQAPQAKASARCSAVAFAFVRRNPRPAERNGKSRAKPAQNAARTLARCSRNREERVFRFTHARPCLASFGGV